jgi:outer membrane protein, heavy metal efflux system
MKLFFRVVMCLGLGATAAAAQTTVIPSRLTLDEALRLAQERSPVLAAARALVAVAEADVVGADQRPNPLFAFVSEGYAFGAGRNRPFLADQEIVLRVDQEFETAGRRGLRTEVATRPVEAARA